MYEMLRKCTIMCKTDEPVLKRRKTSEIDENGLKHEKTDENVYKTKKTYETAEIV